MLSDRDLTQKKYSIAELTASVSNLNIAFLLNTQILDEHFCAEYILDVRKDSGDEDSYKFCEMHILRRQPHLDRKLFLELCKKKYEIYFSNSF